MSDTDVVVLSDYGTGGLAHIATMIGQARAADRRVLVDPKGDDWARYRGATLVTPNRSENRSIDIGRCRSRCLVNDLPGRRILDRERPARRR